MSSTTAFFLRELESLKPRSYDVLRAPLKAFELLPVTSEAGAGAETITYRQYDSTGFAKVVANYADDLPRADISGKEFTARVKSVGASFGYSLPELRAAEMAGKGLEARKVNAATRAMMEEYNRIAFYGDSEHGLQGWLTNANIPTVAATEVSSGVTEWFDSNGVLQKSANDCIADMNAVVNYVVTNTNERHRPNRLVMPVEHYSAAASTPRSTQSDTTILSFFLNSNPYIESVVPANELSEAQLTANGTSFTANIMIAYEADPDRVTFELPVVYEQLPPQELNLGFKVPVHGRCGGVIIYYPLSMAIMEGI